MTKAEKQKNISLKLTSPAELLKFFYHPTEVSLKRIDKSLQIVLEKHHHKVSQTRLGVI